jgi:hypothetical protein
MKSRTMLICAMLLAVCGLVWAFTAKPDFSGSWRLDTGRSVGLRQGMEMFLTVKHDGETLEAETKIVAPPQPETAQKDVFKLDGAETEFTPPQPPGAKGKRSGQWLARGNGFLINETVTAPGPNNGPAVTTNITRKWILSPDGNELTQDLYIDDARGSREVKRIFVRK